MRQTLQLKLGQSLAMTPQLQQAIRLLQLSTLDLQLEIQQALENNPMLESVDESSQHTDTESSGDDNTNSSSPQDEAVQTEKNESESYEETQDYEQSSTHEDIPEELPVDSSWDDIYDGSTAFSRPEESDHNFFENQSGEPDSLQDHLLWQLELSRFSDTDRAIALTLVDSINDEGYLISPTEDLLEGLQKNYPDQEIELDEVEAVLKRIQQFDPLGVGARDLRECLLLQLKQLPPSTPWLEQAVTLATNYLQLLGNRQYANIMRKMKISEPDLQQTITLIQHMNPRPGEKINATAAQYVIPDVFVKKIKNQWVVELNNEFSPRVRVNAQYAGLVKRGDNSSDNQYLRNNLQEARWFIKSLRSRNETLIKVARCIVEKQMGFFEEGPLGMKPMVLREVAEEVEMHESTISRITTQKFMHTPRGIYEFKYFFSSHVSGDDGDDHSAIAIRERIKKLIDDENQRKPLSDSKLSQVLKDEGINVARRTVAKYREAMNIPSSNERRRL